MPELAAHNWLFNRVFLTGKDAACLPFLGIIVIVIGKWGVLCVGMVINQK